MIKSVGIDPGLASTGVGIVRGNKRYIESYSFGTIYTSPKLSIAERLNIIYSELHDFLLKEKPDFVIIEDIFSVKKYPKSGIFLGKASGVILLAAQRIEQDIKIIEVPAKEAKQILTGNGNADKNQLERSVRIFLNAQDKIKPSHASDALALALIGLFRYEKCGEYR
jgi:crossover junction endodeoxyribonuclease RuvC